MVTTTDHATLICAKILLPKYHLSFFLSLEDKQYYTIEIHAESCHETYIG